MRLAIPVSVVALLLSGCASQSASTSVPTSHNGATSQAASEVDLGSSFEKAIVIKASNEEAGVKAEYMWIREHIPGARPAGQKLLHREGKSYDVIHIILADGTERDLYFDISNFFGKM